jgi:tetratricopeptide (TPR) repeat protein
MYGNRAAVRALRGGLCLLALALAGCATTLQSERVLRTASAFPRPVELKHTPFFPQEQYQCGPAALAMVLDTTGLDVKPDDLTPQVFLPEREGSLQIELIAAARRYGRVPYVLRPQLESVLAEVASGNPVLVLQNLGLSWWTQWHYAVVVGFDLADDGLVLRSGHEARHVVSLELFERTWRRADYWAMVVLPPDRLPDTAEEIPYLTSVATFEPLKHWQAASKAYAAALERWPRSLVARIGLGNSLHAMGDLRGAEAAYRQATRDHPDAAVAFNNLAQTLADEGKWNDAEVEAKRAVDLGGPLTGAYADTLAKIQDRAKPAAP